jgi:cytochrome c oxidase assembly protein subunit 15
MPFDVRDFPVGVQIARRNRRAVAGWLFAVCGMILVMTVLGGATRLTGSGLSIMEWAPLSGALPPMSEAEWQRLFHLYQQIPQYQLLHPGLGLDGFKQIFWLEWVHRLWGRLIGVVFIVPLLWLWTRGAINRLLWPRLLLAFALGALQGVVGWFMVASGFFPDSTAVSPYRLVIHLALALVLYAVLLWTGLSVLRPEPTRVFARPSLTHRLAWLAVAAISLTILTGGFVAGLHAGLTYNTFPLMDGSLVPDGYAQLHPWLLNLTENIAAVQFNHRLLASLTAVIVAASLLSGLRSPLTPSTRAALLALGATVAAQYVLGVLTLLGAVPVGLATAHQAVAVLALTAALVALHGLRREDNPLFAPHKPESP